MHIIKNMFLEPFEVAGCPSPLGRSQKKHYMFACITQQNLTFSIQFDEGRRHDSYSVTAVTNWADKVFNTSNYVNARIWYYKNIDETHILQNSTNLLKNNIVKQSIGKYPLFRVVIPLKKRKLWP